jgi:hypothetical protein
MSNTTVGVPTKTPFLSDRQYDILKYVAQVILPAAGTLYGALALLWGWPVDISAGVVGTVVAVDTFMGVALHISSTNYQKNDIGVHGTVGIVDYGPEGGEKVVLNALVDPHEVLASGAKQIVYKTIPKHAAPYDEEPTEQ